MFWLSVPVVLYLSVVLLVYTLQDRLVFPGAGGGGGTPQVPGVAIDWLGVAGGARIRVASSRPAGAPRGVMLLFLGNGEDLRSGAPKARELTAYGLEVMAAEYPGYGESEGAPSVASIHAAAEAAADHAARRAAQLGVPLVLAGSSLGAFPAVHLASLGIGHKLLLAAPPTSVAEAGASHYPWLPVRLLVRHRFDILGLADSVRCPVLVVHGDRDEVVPVDMGRRVATALRGELVVVRGQGHWWLLSPSGPAGEEVRAFLESQ
jgi:pimeloyl-ACP methyl ester carboxylesterase